MCIRDRFFTDRFLEVIIAKGFDKGALEVLSRKKNLRVIESDFNVSSEGIKYKTVLGSYIAQSADKTNKIWNGDWEYWGKVPNAEEKRQLLLAWNVCANLKSNAIAIAGNDQSLGLGMGQVNSCLLYTSPSPRDATLSRMPSSA